MIYDRGVPDLFKIVTCFLYSLAGVAILLFAAACEEEPVEEDGPAGQDTTAVEAGAQSPYPYEVVLYGALADTVQGNAAFGRVLDRDANREQLVILLQASGGFPGGFYITRRDTVMPEVGTFRLADTTRPDSMIAPGTYRILYQEGLTRQLASAGGQVTFDVVSDTLIAGSFDATLSGITAGAGGEQAEGEVRARGTFRARADEIGYFVGL